MLTCLLSFSVVVRLTNKVLVYNYCTGLGMSTSWFSKKRDQFSMSFFHCHSLDYTHTHTHTETNTHAHKKQKRYCRLIVSEEITSMGFSN